MGTLEKIRSISPYFLAAFAVVFVGFMVISDLDFGSLMSSGSNYQTAVIATINGDEILYKDFEEKVREQVEQKRAQMGEEETEINEEQIRQQVWDQMINEILVRQEAKKVGLYVSNAELLDIMLENPPDYLQNAFKDSAGTFQRQFYLDVVTNPDGIYNRLPQTMSEQDKREYVNNWKKDLVRIESDILKQKLYESLSAVVNTANGFVSPSFAEQKYIDEKGSASADYILIDIKSIPDSIVTVSDQEIATYYEKVKKFFEQKPKRKMKYAQFQLKPSEKDSANAMKAVKKISEDFLSVSTDFAKDSMFTMRMRDFESSIIDFKPITEIDQKLAPYISSLPDSSVIGPLSLPDATYFVRVDGKRQGENQVVRASHVLINFDDNKDSAKAEANKLFARAKSGEDFANLARQFSKDPGSGMQGGDLGYFGKGRMVKPFEDAAFAASVGSIVGPIESQFGYHIIKVVDKNSDELKYSQIVIKPSMSKATEKSIKRIAYEFKKELEKGGQNFDTLASKFEVQAKETSFFEQGKPILGSNYLSARAFEAKLNDIFEPLDIKNQGIIVAQVTEIRDAGYAPLDDLKQMITRRILKVKKLDMVKASAEKAFSKVKDLQNLTEASSIDTALAVNKVEKINNTGNMQAAGFDYAFTTSCFELPIGKISGPIRGELGYFIIQVTERELPSISENKADFDYFVTELKKNPSRQPLYYQWYNKVKADAKIEDFRSKYYKEF